MLTEKEIAKIDLEVSHLPYKGAACIEALKIVQQERGWISDESIHLIAEYLEISAEEVDSVATFYNLIFRKPVGRHVILICDSISCWVVGYENILTALKNRLKINYGETTEDDRFTLLPIPCLGTCDRAPAMMIDNDLHRDLTEEKLDDILNQYQ
ncbi:MAG: NADH-quinone oxidoreductase subunit E [Cyclobacteriaceae bacterium]|nr:MAG: NADH-quinone oxidoreductase subunit E [Cyclobacteriaceae bacterium]